MDSTSFSQSFDDSTAENSNSHIPECDDVMKPHVGKFFGSVVDGLNFYKIYAEACGFDVRLGTMRKSKHDVVVHRYIFCNRQGIKYINKDSQLNDASVSKKRRRTRSSRVSCMARVVLKLANSGGGYVITEFIESHSHPFLQGEQKQFLKSSRKMGYAHRSFVVHCKRVNIGAQRLFKLFNELAGGFDKVGCSNIDFKNFSRDLRESVVGIDTQVVLDDLKIRRESSPGFTFDFCVDEEKKLTRLFWADSTSIQNYKLFGEAVSFDATYSTNMYNMIFAPFTGKDNHGKCVTFGAGLLTGEDEDSYYWLLDKFLVAMSGKSPSLFITDQDPALIKAVPRIFPNARHRFCMWHIMFKVADKIPVALRSDADFTQKFNDLVWDEVIEQFEFDQRWISLMDEFQLTGDKWFSKMFDCRASWIPSYFRDFPMSGLFKTTSVSESENSFFQRFLNKNANMIEFFMHFRSAIEQQRHTHLVFSTNDVKSFPDLATNLAIEKHAASFYTYEVFKRVQVSIIRAINDCGMLKMTNVADSSIFELDEVGNGKFTIIFKEIDKSVTCFCNSFIRLGLLCSHVFFVFKIMRVDKIPDQYLLPRWSKSVSFHVGVGCSSVESSVMSSFDNRELVHGMYQCIGLVECDPKYKNELMMDINQLIVKYKKLCDADGASMGKKNLLRNFYGCEVPECVSVLSPSPVKTKGSGSRLQSRREQAIRVAAKPKRKCSKCKLYTNHDARNCPVGDES